MKKLIQAFLMAGICMYALIGCGTTSSKQSEVDSSVVHEQTEATGVEAMAEPGDLIKNEEFQLGTDNLNYLSEPSVAVTENGYYYFLMDYLYYRDKTADQSYIVCTQTNCDHTTDQCDGFYDPYDFRTEQGIWYYDGQLYFLGSKNGLNNYVLCRINPDGTGREILMDLFTLEGEDSIKTITLHRGYLYYTLDTMDETGDMTAVLFQVNLKKKSKPVELYHSDTERSYAYRVRGYGDGVFFQVGAYRDQELTDFQAALWYCTEDGKATHVLDEVWKDYNIIDGQIYYTTETAVERYDWNTGIKEVFMETGRVCMISYDDTYVYLDDYYGVLFDESVDTSDRRIYALDRSGEIVNSWNIPLSESDTCIFGDENYLWIRRYLNVTNEDQGAVSFCALPKSEILSENSDWEIWN